MSDKLKPCPFCGEENDFIYRAAHEGDSYYCNSCKAYGHLSTPENIKELWNKRADLVAEKDAEIERLKAIIQDYRWGVVKLLVDLQEVDNP